MFFRFNTNINLKINYINSKIMKKLATTFSLLAVMLVVTSFTTSSEIGGKSTGGDFTLEIGGKSTGGDYTLNIGGKSTGGDFTQEIGGKSTGGDYTLNIGGKSTGGD